MAAVRELEEEASIKGPTMEFWGTDKQFNCDIYLYKLEPQDTMERMDPEKNSKWRLYTLEEYRALSKQKECTDSHNKYYGSIINSIKEKKEKQVFQIKKEPKRKRSQTEEEKMIRCTNCNLHYPATQRHNCQRGFREGE